MPPTAGQFLLNMASAEDYSPQEPMEYGEEVPTPAALAASSSGEMAEDYDLEDALLETVAKSERIERMIQAAMAGALPRSRALKPWEPDKLNPRHISVIMLRAVGYRQNRIAELTGYEQAVVSVVLRHPDSQTILSAILAEGAKQAIGIAAQVKREAPKMLKIVQEIADDRDVKPETRVRAAFGWLNMYERIEEREAGAGTGDADKMSLNRDDASRLIAAIEESKRVREVSFVVVNAPAKADPNEILVDSVPLASSSLPGSALSPEQLRQWELEQALEERIAQAAPTQGQADGSELAPPAQPESTSLISRSFVPGRIAQNRTDLGHESRTEPTVLPTPSAVGVRTERQVSTSNVEKAS